jgi:hypothetical protein
MVSSRSMLPKNCNRCSLILISSELHIVRINERSSSEFRILHDLRADLSRSMAGEPDFSSILRVQDE